VAFRIKMYKRVPLLKYKKEIELAASPKGINLEVE
jgi:hypothetical protein